MKVLAIEKEIENTEREKLRSFLTEEAKKIWELMQDGIIREIYFTKKDNCAVIILECEDENEAGSILKSLPLVRENLISFEIKALVPYNGFDRLFN